MTSHPLPVLVVGNGPVGQTAALSLARWGVPSILLDSRPERDPIGSKAIAQQRDVLDIWESFGAGRQLAEEGLTFRIGRTYYKDEELFSVELQREQGTSAFPPFVNISQQRTEEVMDELIAASDLIDVRWGHDVQEFRQDDDGVSAVCIVDGNRTEVAGSYAIACPGARADALRTTLGVTLDGETFGDRFLITDLVIDMPEWASERRFYFDPPFNPGRQVLIHACPGSTYRVDWQVPEDYDLDEAERTGELDRLIRTVTEGRDYEISWKSVYRFHARVANRMRVGRVLIAGDGAHLVAPFGARGLNSGVPDAENAAWKIAYVVKGWADESLLETYHEERRAAALENLAVVGETMRFLVPLTEEDRQTRLETLEQARTDASVHGRINSGRMAEPFWYSESSLTTPDPTRPAQGRPAKGEMPLPAPGVLVPDLPIVDAASGATRLRELVRNGFTVLVGDDASAARLVDALPDGRGSVRVCVREALSPTLDSVLGAKPDEVWVIRPDGHVAAVLPEADPATVRDSIDRALARLA